MTRFAIDAHTAIRLARERIVLPPDHQLVAPNVLQTQAMSLVYRDVRRGELSEPDARALLDRITTMRIRLLGDRVSRATAWKVAIELDWDDTTEAEYVAVAKLQSDMFVTLDDDLARRVEGIVAIAPFDALVELASPS